MKARNLVLSICFAALPLAAAAQTTNSSEARTPEEQFASEQEKMPPPTIDPRELKILPQSMAREALAVHAISSDESAVSPFAGTTLPLFAFTDNGATGDIVGTSPTTPGTANIPVVIVPVVLKPKQGGTTFSFDPTATDPGCLGGSNTAIGLLEQSPLLSQPPFQAPIVLNGVNEGATQYLDAFLRSEFATTVNATHHTVLSPVTVGATLTVLLSAGTAGSTTAEVFSVGGTQCGTNAGAVNPKAKLSVVNINTLFPLLTNYITAHGLNPGQFVLFVMYDSVMSNGAANNLNNCCILGFHNASGTSVSAPGQTFAICDFQGDNQTVFGGVADASACIHEIAEWANDPSGQNPVPGTWGNIGQVSGCQGNFEVGDPLSGTLAPNITAANGFTYHFQELAYFSWFYRDVPSQGAGGFYSSNGTFRGDSRPCPPGGTN